MNYKAEKKLFVDEERFNCPFCRTSAVIYDVKNSYQFNWSLETLAQLFIVECTHCLKAMILITKDTKLSRNHNGVRYQFDHTDKDLDKYLNKVFFYKHPSKSVHIDERIPEKIRALIDEFDKCIDVNSITGAAACLRKVIYELLKDQDTIIYMGEEKNKTNYKASIDKLDDKYDKINSKLFLTLKEVMNMTSNKVHEEAWTDWDAGNLKYLQEVVLLILSEIYVREDEEKQIQQNIDDLRVKLIQSEGEGDQQ